MNNENIIPGKHAPAVFNAVDHMMKTQAQEIYDKIKDMNTNWKMGSANGTYTREMILKMLEEQYGAKLQ